MSIAVWLLFVRIIFNNSIISWKVLGYIVTITNGRLDKLWYLVTEQLIYKNLLWRWLRRFRVDVQETDEMRCVGGFIF